jgi:predicted ATP-grasp superfamily ATP-dependent carboligase
MDLDFRFDMRDGQYKLLDFNPRIGANFRMFEDRAGLDVARALHLDLSGRFVFRSPPVEGRTFVVEPHDLFASAGHVCRGELTVREWRRSLGGRLEVAWLHRDDPFPFLMMCVRMLSRVGVRALRVLRESVRIRVSRPQRRRGASVVARPTPAIVPAPERGEPVLPRG